MLRPATSCSISIALRHNTPASYSQLASDDGVLIDTISPYSLCVALVWEASGYCCVCLYACVCGFVRASYCVVFLSEARRIPLRTRVALGLDKFFVAFAFRAELCVFTYIGRACMAWQA